ncbi:M23 family metallopeptidase [Shewanella eurypsychrophilus]|uniref:M23 family metallopeptidase n=1 Tax=Shewanella eurypsychrophilus TaxID=2593656 RepID=A0ABX8S2K6_9GAMM|nr:MULTISPECIES: M23 family metallopeptidase [Shewanella]QFU23220.1 peptidoglycan DD-metalloendopeptidase family protein [Shewanella sp. YLB-09]QXP44812.1 M23 family metallopeptidase [Shewanella eurypsychrophilus]
MSFFAKCSISLSLLVTFNVFAQVELVGKMEQGALIRGQVEVGTQVFLNNEAIKVTPDGAFAFGFSREAELKQELTLIYPDGLTQIKPLRLATKQYKIDKVNGISKKIMKPDPKAVERSRKDSKQVKAARSQFSESNAFVQDFIWPLTGRISGVYGSQRVYNGKPGNPHYGVDVAAKTGTVVVAPADGVISLSVPDMFYSGGTIILDHGYGVSSSFLHLSKLYVKEGEAIKQGQPIAEVGATGRVTGPHLDWRVNWYQMRLDPVTIVPDMAEVLKK